LESVAHANIHQGVTEKQVKSRYRKLSITLHPDKARPDEAKNETEEFINERWVEIIKAFKTLTDDDVRQNYEQYGNPDGKQSTSIGIALPQFLVEAGSGKYVMLVYGALLGILLPYFVGSWWYGSQKVTKEKVLVDSVGKLFKEYSERMDQNGVINALSVGDEYKEVLKGHKSDSGLGQVEKRILAPGPYQKTVAGMTLKDQQKLSGLDDGSRRKALALLWAYLGRIELDDATLNEEKIEVAPTALALNDAFLSIALAYGFTNPILGSYKAAQAIIQAMPPDAPPLLQLPYFTLENIKKVEDSALSSERRHLTVQAFMDLPEASRKQFTNGAGISTSQYEAAVAVASQLPRLVVETTFFKVTGEKYCLPGSLVQFVVKARFIPPGTTTVPAVKPADLEDEDPDDTNPKAKRDRDALVKQHQPPLAHAPLFARDHPPKWHLFLSDARQGKMAVPPFTFQTFDKPILTADGQPTFEVQTLKMQFQAPPQPGQYRFQMHLVCDSYLGFDYKQEAVLDIEDPAKAEEVESDDDISEPDEGKPAHMQRHTPCNHANIDADTIAGQMAALRGDTPAEKPDRRRRPVQDEDEDESDESGTDEDEESNSDTDTDTDTDED